MSETDARAFLTRVSEDAAFAAELTVLKEDQAAVLAKVHRAGFDATQDEIRQAFSERYRDELTMEQLDAVAGGLDEAGITALVSTGAAVGGVALAAGVMAI